MVNSGTAGTCLHCDHQREHQWCLPADLCVDGISGKTFICFLFLYACGNVLANQPIALYLFYMVVYETIINLFLNPDQNLQYPLNVICDKALT